jgi:predicted acetyltransferase
VLEFSEEVPPWEFAFQYDPSEPFPAYVYRVNSWPKGVDGLVPSSYLVAVVDEMVVGRVSIGHDLNDFLKKYGGHVGYRPVAFWFCTFAYFVFGVAIVFCAWFVL